MRIYGLVGGNVYYVAVGGKVSVSYFRCEMPGINVNVGELCQ